MKYEAQVVKNDRESSQGETSRSVTSSLINPTRTSLGSKPRLRDERRLTKRLGCWDTRTGYKPQPHQSYV